MRGTRSTKIDLIGFTNISAYLTAILEARSSQNSAYSLRSFARDLGISPTTASHLLSHKIKVTSRTQSPILKGLKANKSEVKYFKLLVEYESAKSQELQNELLPQLKAMSPAWASANPVQTHQWNLLEHWFILAVLELLPLCRERSSIPQMANRLGIQTAEVAKSIDLLLQKGIIEETVEGEFLRTNKQMIFDSEGPNSLLQNFHRQMLGKARIALAEQNNTQKFVGSETFAIAAEDLPELKEVLETCFQQVLAICQKSQNHTDVYHLGIQLFNLTPRKS